MQQGLYKVFAIGLCLIISIGCISSSVALSKTEPAKIAVNNNEQVTVSLSRTDINRLFVDKEKITSINAPSGLFSAHNDRYGSIYANIYGEKPFTAFFTTNKGRHFSLLIVPKSEPGQTLAFLPKTKMVRKQQPIIHHRYSARHFEHSSDYEKTLIKLIRIVLQGKTPPGYTRIAKSAFYSIPEYQVPKYLNHKKTLTEQVRAVYLGGDLAVRVLVVKNLSHKSITLVANHFYRPGVRALSIMHEKIASQGSTQVIEVVSNV